MPTENELTSPAAAAADLLPSADFIRAVSDLLDTDPGDLLGELGYYDRRPDAGTDDTPVTAES